MDNFLGQIIIIAGTYAPRGYALCNGQLLSVSQNSALFSLLGYTYGGNGSTTFALPNLQGRVAIHVGQSPGTSNYVLGQSGGAESVTLSANNLPPHSHAMACNSGAGTTSSPVNAVLATPPSTRTSAAPLSFTNSAANSTMGASAIAPAGASQPVSVLQPYLPLNYCICTSGIYPSRP